MTFVWLAVLIGYGLAVGFDTFNGLDLWLLLPFIVQDLYNAKIKRTIEKLHYMLFAYTLTNDPKASETLKTIKEVFDTAKKK